MALKVGTAILIAIFTQCHNLAHYPKGAGWIIIIKLSQVSCGFSSSPLPKTSNDPGY